MDIPFFSSIGGMSSSETAWTSSEQSILQDEASQTREESVCLSLFPAEEESAERDEMQKSSQSSCEVRGKHTHLPKDAVIIVNALKTKVYFQANFVN